MIKKVIRRVYTKKRKNIRNKKKSLRKKIRGGNNKNNLYPVLDNEKKRIIYKKPILDIASTIISLNTILSPLLLGITTNNEKKEKYLKTIRILNENEYRSISYFDKLYDHVFNKFPLPIINKKHLQLSNQIIEEEMFYSLFSKRNIITYTFFLPGICTLLLGNQKDNNWINLDEYNYIIKLANNIIDNIDVLENDRMESKYKDRVETLNGGKKRGGSPINMKSIMQIIYTFIFISFLSTHSNAQNTNSIIDIAGSVSDIVNYNIQKDYINELQTSLKERTAFFENTQLNDAIEFIADRNVDNTVDQYNHVLSLSSDVIKLVTELNASPTEKIKNMFDFISKTSNEIFLSTFPNEVKPLNIDFPSTTGRSTLRMDKNTGQLNVNLAQKKGTTLKLTLDVNIIQDLTIHGFSENKLLDLMKSMMDKNEISTERQVQLFTNTFKCYQSQVNCYNDILKHTSIYYNELRALFDQTAKNMFENMGLLYQIIEETTELITIDKYKYYSGFSNIINILNPLPVAVTGKSFYGIVKDLTGTNFASLFFTLSNIPVVGEDKKMIDKLNPQDEVKIEISETNFKQSIINIGTLFSGIESKLENNEDVDFVNFVQYSSKTFSDAIYDLFDKEENMNESNKYTMYLSKCMEILGNSQMKNVWRYIDFKKNE
jgi:hypothetical protein